MNARVLEIIADKRVCLRQAYRIAKREGAIKHDWIKLTPEFIEIAEATCERTAYRRLKKPSKDKINKDYKTNKGEWV